MNGVSSPTATSTSVALPALPDPTACQYDVLTHSYVPYLCSFCNAVTTSNRCATLMADSIPHYFVEGEARCARAFCPTCSISLAPGDFETTARASTCPFHLLQGLKSDHLAGIGPESKQLDADALPSNDGHASSEEHGPSSDGAMET